MFQINDVHDRREMAQYYNVPVPVVSPQPVYMFTNEHHIPTVAEDKVFVPSRRFPCPMVAIPRVGTVLDMKINTVQM